MALSVLNYFYFKVEDANLPFILADVAVIGILHLAENRLKESKKYNQEVSQKQEAMQSASDKAAKKAQDMAIRAQQKQAAHDARRDKVAKGRVHVKETKNKAL